MQCFEVVNANGSILALRTDLQDFYIYDRTDQFYNLNVSQL